jgi:predicted PurR-regulated permease PerM
VNAWVQTPWVKALVVVASLALAALVLYYLRVVLTPFFLAFALAYLLDPAVDGLQRLRLPRSGAIAVLLLCVAGAIIALILVIYPTLRLQVETLAQALPGYVTTIQAWLTPVIERVAQMDPARAQAFLQEILQRFEGLPWQILSHLSVVLGSTLESLRGLFTVVLNLFVIPVVTFYFLRDIDHMRVALPTFLPVSYRDWLMSKIAEIDTLLSGFVRGQLLVALTLMVLYTIGLALVGTPSSILLGLLAGAASMVPFMGLVVGFFPSLLLTYLQYHDWQHLVGVAAVFIVVQALEGNFITPKIVGERLGLHPVVVLLAVLVGGDLFGFLGILLAVPATAVIKVFWRDVLAFYRAL